MKKLERLLISNADGKGTTRVEDGVEERHGNIHRHHAHHRRHTVTGFTHNKEDVKTVDGGVFPSSTTSSTTNTHKESQSKLPFAKNLPFSLPFSSHKGKQEVQSPPLPPPQTLPSPKIAHTTSSLPTLRSSPSSSSASDITLDKSATISIPTTASTTKSTSQTQTSPDMGKKSVKFSSSSNIVPASSFTPTTTTTTPTSTTTATPAQEEGFKEKKKKKEKKEKKEKTHKKDKLSTPSTTSTTPTTTMPSTTPTPTPIPEDRENIVSLVHIPPTKELINKPPVVQEVQQRHELTEIQPIIYRERQQTEIRQITEPTMYKIYLPETVDNRTLPSEYIDGGESEYRNIPPTTRIEKGVVIKTIYKDPIVIETFEHPTIEEIQPVIYRHRIQPTSIIQPTTTIVREVSMPATTTTVRGSQQAQQQVLTGVPITESMFTDRGWRTMGDVETTTTTMGTQTQLQQPPPLQPSSSAMLNKMEEGLQQPPLQTLQLQPLQQQTPQQMPQQTPQQISSM